MPTPTPQGRPAPPARWWREAEAAWLVALVVAVYFSRAADLPLRGEEPTRAQVAFEMLDRGDWVVPREQGDPFLVRPPLQNWLIAASTEWFGRRDAWAVRFPSLAATMLTTLLVYGYSRTFLARPGALAAGVAFATLGEMFQMGRQAETEALFILLVSASLLVWHCGLVRRWPAALTWASGYGLMALAALTKGPQAPAYFVGSVIAYLVLTRQWRRLFSRAHLLGILTGAAVVGLWLVPFYLRVGLAGVREVWMGDPALRAQRWAPADVASHLLVYPPVIFGGTLPWSALLVLYFRRDLRRSLGAARPQALFLGLCLAVAFPTCWVHPGGQPRFFAPLFPCLAVLAGLAAQRCADAAPGSPLRAAWGRYLSAAAAVMALGAATALGAAACWAYDPTLVPWAEPPVRAAAYAAAAALLAWVTLRARPGGGPVRLRAGVLALAAFLTITFTGVVTDVRVRRSEDAAAAMVRLKGRLPPDQPLVSLGGHTDSLFAYLYGNPLIAPRPWPRAPGQLGPDATYFSFVREGAEPPLLPFPWEEVGVVPLDRNHHEPPERVVVVGRRLGPDPAAAASR
jgi:4-amino-4-deoxy-L-arabinose transferase-like glycosyltransferase